MKALFEAHLKQVLAEIDRHLAELKSDQLVIDAGNLEYHFADDQAKSFRPAPLFNYLCPLMSEGHAIHYKPGQKPVLHYFLPNDFWHDVQPPSHSFWNDSFEITIHNKQEDVWSALKDLQKTIYIGANEARGKELSFEVNPQKFVDRLDWQRSFKTEFEIECIKVAGERAAKGHLAAKDAFFRGGSELDIHQAYMKAIATVEANLPFWSTVAMNEKAAILHYETKREIRDGKVILIDAGARHLNYASDITRTYYTDDAHPVFKQLIDRVNSAQLVLCDAIKPGLSYPELHHQANVELFKVLDELDVLQHIGVDSAIDNELVKTFFPHGLGHMLGLQVHDVGGYLVDEKGNKAPAPERYPHLRTTRTLEENVVLTVEPGLYFIPMLLEKMKSNDLSKHINWSLVDELIPYGGVRIEDDIVVRSGKAENLTRPFLP